MAVSLVLTLIGVDRPGLVRELSRTLAAHDANWLESRMARLAGRFAGILRATVPEANADALMRELARLASVGLTVNAERSAEPVVAENVQPLRLELVGNDRPGIIRDIAAALAGRSINFEELESEVTSAPMTGQSMFTARARLRIPDDADTDELRSELERLANDLMVDIDLEEV